MIKAWIIDAPRTQKGTGKIDKGAPAHPPLVSGRAWHGAGFHHQTRGQLEGAIMNINGTFAAAVAAGASGFEDLRFDGSFRGARR